MQKAYWQTAGANTCASLEPPQGNGLVVANLPWGCGTGVNTCGALPPGGRMLLTTHTPNCRSLKLLPEPGELSSDKNHLPATRMESITWIPRYRHHLSAVDLFARWKKSAARPICIEKCFKAPNSRRMLFYRMANNDLTVLQVTGQVTQYRPRLRPGKVSMIPWSSPPIKPPHCHIQYLRQTMLEHCHTE